MSEENENKEVEQLELLCKNCSAKLKYNPGTDHLKCEFCGTENEIEASNEIIEEIDFEKFLNENDASVETQEINVVKCSSCSAETTFDENIISDTCAFCGSNIVVKEGSSTKIIKPKSLLPFKIDNKTAFSEYSTWIKKLWWAPSALKKNASLTEKIVGMYIPFWTYDSKTTTHYRGSRGDNYTTTETYTQDGQTKTRTVTKTRWTSVSGTVYRNFDDVLVIGTTSLPRKHLAELEPWDLENLIPFDEQYIVGYRSESYHVNVKDGFGDAKGIMKSGITSSVNTDIGGDKQRIGSMNINHDDITFKHILLPVYISAFKFNEKIYRVVINARTGEVQGERPYSWIKIASAIIAGLAIIGAAVYLINEYA